MLYIVIMNHTKNKKEVNEMKEKNTFKTNLEEVQIGDIAHMVAGPGEYAELNSCYFTGIVIEKVINKWGTHIIIKNLEGKTQTAHSLTDIGIGTYIKA